MATGSNVIRGSRVGAAPMKPINEDTVLVDRIAVSYWDALGNETIRYFAADVAPEDIPEQIDCPRSGLPAGRDKENPPGSESAEPYKTHLAYVKERRTEAEAEELLNEAIQKFRARRGQVAAE